MSLHDPKPHTVKVYGYDGEGEQKRLILLRLSNFPSKGAADRFASEQRQLREVSSAVVMPTGAAASAYDRAAG